MSPNLTMQIANPVSEQVVSFSHPVGSTVTGIISVTGSDATQSLVSGGFLFDAGFNLLSGLASLLLVALIWLGFNLFHDGMETRAGDNRRLRRVYKVGFWDLVIQGYLNSCGTHKSRKCNS